MTRLDEIEERLAADVINILVDQFLPARHMDKLRADTCERCGSQNRVLADGMCVDCWEEQFPGLKEVGSGTGVSQW